MTIADWHDGGIVTLICIKRDAQARRRREVQLEALCECWGQLSQDSVIIPNNELRSRSSFGAAVPEVDNYLLKHQAKSVDRSLRKTTDATQTPGSRATASGSMGAPHDDD